MKKNQEQNPNKMADFDVETVATTNKLSKVKLDILNRRQLVMDAYRQYTKYKTQGYGDKGLTELK